MPTKSRKPISKNKILDKARGVLRIEADAIAALIEKIDDRFVQAVEEILACQGKVVLTGIGKSGVICQKIAATLASTGTPAYFLHPAEGVHGDLGTLSRRDVVIVLSMSGESDEISTILPVIKRMGIRLIAMTGNLTSTLAKYGDIVIDVGVKEEACPLGLAPTASTTAALAMGDALAVSLLERRGFSEEDFALIHPGGRLGRRLLLRVEDLMHTGEEIPMVLSGTLLKEAVLEITSKGLGVTGVCDEQGRLVGVITDGDLRRGLERSDQMLKQRVDEMMTLRPKTIEPNALAARALQQMEEYSITSLFIAPRRNTKRVVGILHLHDILRAGLV